MGVAPIENTQWFTGSSSAETSRISPVSALNRKFGSGKLLHSNLKFRFSATEYRIPKDNFYGSFELKKITRNFEFSNRNFRFSYRNFGFFKPKLRVFEPKRRVFENRSFVFLTHSCSFCKDFFCPTFWRAQSQHRERKNAEFR
jgi:hypothetical protein